MQKFSTFGSSSTLCIETILVFTFQAILINYFLPEKVKILLNLKLELMGYDYRLLSLYDFWAIILPSQRKMQGKNNYIVVFLD